jgi:drug/metabolite transporter (DMT)-like permease
MKTHASPPPALGLPELALIAITFIWGGTFLVVQHAVTVSGPLAFVAARFAVAASIGALICRGQLRHLTKAELLTGMAIGVSIFGGYALQTYGLMHITSSKSAFITAFYVPIVPLVQWLVFKQRPYPAVWAAVALAFVGLLLLTGTDGLNMALGTGELITAVGAIAIALEIILISRVSPQMNILRVTIVQLATASLIALLLMPVMGEAPPVLSKTFILSVLALGCASALIQYVMNWAQKRISATKATLIYAGEPVWAGVIGRIAGERLPALAIVGALLIICAGILSEWRPRRLRADGKAVMPSD